MCNYSLKVFPNRLARDGEELLVHRFSSGTIGLAARLDLEQGTISFPGRRNRTLFGEIRFVLIEIVDGQEKSKAVPAVCIPPGARLLLRDIPQHLQRKIGIGREEEVTLTQVSLDSIVHQDAVHFRNGCVVSLQQLHEGQRVRVLTNSLADTTLDLEVFAPAS